MKEKDGTEICTNRDGQHLYSPKEKQKAITGRNPAAPADAGSCLPEREPLDCCGTTPSLTKESPLNESQIGSVPASKEGNQMVSNPETAVDGKFHHPLCVGEAAKASESAGEALQHSHWQAACMANAGAYAKELQPLLLEKDWPETLCLLVVAGSHAYGMARPGSDLDIRGIYLKSLDDFLLEKTDATIMLPGGDVVLHPLGKFIHLACQGNPAVLEWLFTKPEEWLYADENGKRLLDHRTLFLSRKTIAAYKGFAKGSWKDLQKKLERLPESPSASQRMQAEKHGRHLIRLLRQLEEIVRDGQLHLKVKEMPPVLCQEAGQWKLHPKYLEELERLSVQLKEEIAHTDLPERPDKQKVEELVKTIHLQHLQNTLAARTSGQNGAEKED